jgi:hypothetical protein
VRLLAKPPLVGLQHMWRAVVGDGRPLLRDRERCGGGSTSDGTRAFARPSCGPAKMHRSRAQRRMSSAEQGRAHAMTLLTKEPSLCNL